MVDFYSLTSAWPRYRFRIIGATTRESRHVAVSRDRRCVSKVSQKQSGQKRSIVAHGAVVAWQLSTLGQWDT